MPKVRFLTTYLYRSATDPSPGVFEFALTEKSVMEECGTFTLAVKRSAGHEGRANVLVKYFDDSAKADTDYVNVNHMFTFLDKQDEAVRSCSVGCCFIRVQVIACE